MYLASGSERCIDSAACIAAQAIRDGVKVVWEEYESMSHVFMIFFPTWKQTELIYQRWVEFVKKCSEGKKIESRGVVIGVRDLKERAVDLKEGLTDLTPGFAWEVLQQEKVERERYVERIRNGGMKALL